MPVLKNLDCAYKNATIRACEKGSQWLLPLGLRRVRDWVPTNNATIRACEKGSQWLLSLGLRRVRDWVPTNNATSQEANLNNKAFDLVSLLPRKQNLNNKAFDLVSLLPRKQI